MTTEEAIKIWKEQKLVKCALNFSCGGDEMGDMNWEFEGESGDTDSSDLEAYFNDVIFDKVQFYVNSDGHYQGEAGTVLIILEEDSTDFTYVKEAEAEYEETINIEVEVEFSPEAALFIKENASNVRQEYSGSVDITYKKDVVITDKEQLLIDEITEKLKERIHGFSYELGEDDDEELDECRAIEIYEEDIKKGNLKQILELTVRQFKPSDE